METTLDRFGRIVIPKKVRKDFNLKPGAHLKIEETDDTIVLKPVSDEAGSAQGPPDSYGPAQHIWNNQSIP